MKKIFLTLVVWAFASSAFAAGSVSQGETTTYRDNMRIITLTCTADESDGSFPATDIAIGDADGFYLYEIRTAPGATAPTDATDLTLTNSNGLDVLGGAGTDKIDATSSLRFFPKNTDGEYAFPAITETPLTLTITNNSVNAAVFTIEIVFVK